MDQAQDPWEIHRLFRLKRIVHPHIALEKLAHDCLGMAEAASGKVQMYWCVAAMTFAALSVETFLNVVGDSCIKHWDDIEWSAPKSKLAIIENVFRFETKRDDRPFKTFNELFSFRNLIVHAKPESLTIDFVENHDYAVPVSTSGQTPSPKWEKCATIENARTFVGDATEIIFDLAKRGNIQLTSQDHSRIDLQVKIPNDSSSSNNEQSTNKTVSTD
jgi:hypothetical protein